MFTHASKGKDLIGVIKYILDNPVRKGIVDNYHEYPYAGSDEFDIRRF